MEVRSKTWTHRVEANFTNRSSRYVDLFWVDYQGALVRYHKRMAPNELKKLITFATHPWVARDSDTGQAMYLSGRPVYITSLQKEEKREPVEVPIHIPGKVLLIFVGFFFLSLCLVSFSLSLLSEERLYDLGQVDSTTAVDSTRFKCRFPHNKVRFDHRQQKQSLAKVTFFQFFKK